MTQESNFTKTVIDRPIDPQVAPLIDPLLAPKRDP